MEPSGTVTGLYMYCFTFTSYENPYCYYIYIYIFFFLLFCGAAAQRGPHSWGFLDHKQRRTTVGRTSLDEWSARRSDIYLTTKIHNRHIHSPGGITIHDLSRRSATHLRFRPRGDWDRHIYIYIYVCVCVFGYIYKCVCVCMCVWAE